MNKLMRNREKVIQRQSDKTEHNIGQIQEFERIKMALAMVGNFMNFVIGSRTDTTDWR
jgi:hypothetical protein